NATTTLPASSNHFVSAARTCERSPLRAAGCTLRITQTHFAIRCQSLTCSLALLLQQPASLSRIYADRDGNSHSWLKIRNCGLLSVHHHLAKARDRVRSCCFVLRDRDRIAGNTRDYRRLILWRGRRFLFSTSCKSRRTC